MIIFDHVSKSYHLPKFHKRVFSDLHLAIRPGDSIGICGANGAGTSTLMRMIAGSSCPARAMSAGR